MSRKWTEEEVNELREFVDRGFTNQQMSFMFGRTPQAVANKKMELKDPEYYSKRRATEAEIIVAPVGYESEPWLTGFAVLLSFALFLGGVMALAGGV